MAYDLLYKTRIPVNCSMNQELGPSLNKPTATIIGLSIGAFVRGLFAQTSRRLEIQRYQREFRPGHHPTLELPVIPSNSDLLFERTGTNG